MQKTVNLTGKKIAAIALSAVLLVGGSVAGTMAYLQSTDSVTNTFTVGQVIITLDETDVDNSTAGDNDRDKANAYKLIPGQTFVKDPIVHVDATSENCFLFVKVENAIQAIESKDASKTVAGQLAAQGWLPVSDEAGVYYYKEICGAGFNIPVFTEFTIDSSVDNATLKAYDGKSIVVTAYAVQAAGFGSAQIAWDTTFGAPAQSVEG